MGRGWGNTTRTLNVHPPESYPSNTHCPEPCLLSSASLTPEDIRSFSKAATRNGTLNNSKKRTITIVINVPWKTPCEKLRISNKNKIKGERKKGAFLTSLQNNPNVKWKHKKNTQTDCVMRRNKETLRLVCMDRVPNGVDGEDLVRCTQCKMLAHEKLRWRFLGIYLPKL